MILSIIWGFLVGWVVGVFFVDRRESESYDLGYKIGFKKAQIVKEDDNHETNTKISRRKMATIK